MTEASPKATYRTIIYRLLRLSRYSPLMAFAALWVVLVYVATGLVIPLLYKDIFEGALPSSNGKHLTLLLAFLGLTLVVRGLCWWGRQKTLSHWSSDVAFGLRSEVLERYGDQSPLTTTMAAPKLITLLTKEIAIIEQILLVDGPRAFIGLLLALFSFVMIFVLEWRLALLATLLLPLTAQGQILLTPIIHRANARRKEAETNVVNCIKEIAESQVEIQAFSLRTFWHQRFLSFIDSLRIHEARTGSLGLIAQATTKMGAKAIQVIVVGGGAVLVLYRVMSFGELVGFIAFLAALSTGITAYSDSSPVLFRAADSLEQFHHILENKETAEHDVPDELVEPLQSSIQLNNLSFGYDDEKPILRNIDLKLRRGESIAITGPSGSGKSTLLYLLMGFHRAQEGSLLWDKTPVSPRTLASLRSHLGVVMQDTVLFQLSVRENIRLGKLDATQEDIVEAAKAAEIHDTIIGMPQGYDTVVDKDIQLSGGQRQRIAMARALVRKPAVLLLDEATNALDSKTEAELNATLAKIAKTCTLINVTHRLSSVQEYDNIVVLEKGQIVEQGTHDFLLKRQGLYAELHLHQNQFVPSEDEELASPKSEHSF